MPSVLHVGNMKEVLADYPSDYFDSVVTDPPYELNFMSKSWDNRGVSFDPETWKAILRVMKPGAQLLSFGGSRTYHRIAVAIEDAGLEIRDTLQWLYGSGFPKSLDVSKAIDKALGAERKIVGSKLGQPGYSLKENDTENHSRGQYGKFTDAESECAITAPATELAQQWDGWGTALKPAYEPIILARKPLIGTVAQNVMEYGAGGLNIDASRIETTDNLNGGAYAEIGNRQESQSLHGGSGMNVPGKTVGKEFSQPIGRWPANILLDEEAAQLLDEQSGERAVSGSAKSGRAATRGGYDTDQRAYGKGMGDIQGPLYNDRGGASRFFYTAKASKRERNAGLDDLEPKSNRINAPRTSEREKFSTLKQNHHPTVKPLALMRYLVKLITPPDGIILDPFVGSGTTGCAAALESFSFVGIDLSEEYIEIARKRIEYWSQHDS